MLRTGPCDWPLDYEDCNALDSLTPERREQVESTATEYLWRWTGQRFGLCPETIRPCGECECRGTLASSTFYGSGPFPRAGWQAGAFVLMPYILGGQWYNLPLCGSCRVPPFVRLPGPAHEVTEVVINGSVLDPEAYRLVGDRLYRVDGEFWPSEQDLYHEAADPLPGLGEGEHGTDPYVSAYADFRWQIAYDRGVPVPAGGRIAAGALACELAKALTNDRSCQLPQRVQTVTRQGVTVALLDAFDDVEKGHTGIWTIDSWIASVTQTGPPRSAVLSPDRRRRY